MNPFSDFLTLLASAFEHFVGDPVHTQAATAIKSTVQAAAQVKSEEQLEELHGHLSAALDHGRATTAEEWAKLYQAAEDILKRPAPAAEAPAPVEEEPETEEEPVSATPPPVAPSAPSSPSA